MLNKLRQLVGWPEPDTAQDQNAALRCGLIESGGASERIVLARDGKVLYWPDWAHGLFGMEARRAVGLDWRRLMGHLHCGGLPVQVVHPAWRAWSSPLRLRLPQGGTALVTAVPVDAPVGAPTTLQHLRVWTVPAVPPRQQAGAWAQAVSELKSATLTALAQLQETAQALRALGGAMAGLPGVSAVAFLASAGLAQHQRARWGDRGRSRSLVRELAAECRRLRDALPAPAPGVPEAASADELVLRWPVHEGEQLIGMLGIRLRVDCLHEGMLEIVDQVLSAVTCALAVSLRERLLSGIFGSALDAVVSIDRHMRVCLFNPAAERMFGMQAGHIIGQPFEQLLPTHRREVHLKALHTILRGSAGGQRTRAVRMLTATRADGSPFPIEVAISCSGSGVDRHLTAIIRDASDLREAMALRQAAAEAQAANAAKSAFLSRMSHELRTPLNAVIGFAQLMLYSVDPALHPAHEGKVRHILDSGKHLLTLIEDLLDMGRIEAGALRVSLEPVPLGPLMERVLESLSPQVQAAAVKVTIQPEPRAWPVVSADPTRLLQVLLNLIGNAVKYNRSGGRVDLHVEATHGVVVVTIADSGVGLDQEALRHLFEPYNRLGRERGGVGGTGLGLVISKQLVEAMRGQIAVESELGRGTQVRVRLVEWLPGPQPNLAVH